VAAQTVIAAGGSNHEIPWTKLIIPQVVNFSIFAVVLYFLLNRKIKNYFSGRGDAFQAAAKNAKVALEAARAQYNELKNKIEQIQSQGKEEVLKAQKEAQALGAKIIQEARELAVKVEADAKSSIVQEHFRSISALKAEFLEKSFVEAESKVKGIGGGSADRELQSAFVVKAKAVRA
jgi:F-type H+-transporting ATPase subunit b